MLSIRIMCISLVVKKEKRYNESEVCLTSEVDFEKRDKSLRETNKSLRETNKSLRETMMIDNDKRDFN